jgi:hypothetical protein
MPIWLREEFTCCRRNDRQDVNREYEELEEVEDYITECAWNGEVR